MSCQYCDTPAVRHTEPPLCPVHFDLVVLIEYMESKKWELTIEDVIATLRLAKLKGGAWTLTEEMIPNLLPDYLEVKKTKTPQ
ncbi:MAG: hypothetical protein KDJ52_00055 [Anaerolineae bacterium]|nr:hypothetical protein [Anaerolineae bacterium]